MERSESKYRSGEDLALRNRDSSNMNDATSTTDESDLWAEHNWEPFSLDLETNMTTDIDPDATAEAKRKACEIDPGAATEMCGTYAGQNVRFSPPGPVLN